MESLLEKFLETDEMGEEEADHPIIGPNEYIEFSAKLSKEGRTMETVCNMRWPEARHEELDVLQRRLKRFVDWPELNDKLDALHERWQAPLRGKDQSAGCTVVTFAIATTKGRRVPRSIDLRRVHSMALGSIFATVLLSAKSEDRGQSGEIWRFPVSEMQSGNWRPSPRTEPVSHYQVSYNVQTHLYLLDGPFLRVVDLNKGDVLRANFYHAAKLSDTIRFSSIRANRAGVVLALSRESNVVVLAYVALGAEPSLTVLDCFQCEAEQAAYSSICLAPASGLEHELLLGRSDGWIERYSLVLGSEEVKFNQQGVFELFRPRTSTASGKDLGITPGQPIQGLYLRGPRISAYTDHDWVTLSQIEGIPQVYLKGKPENPMIDQHVHADLIVRMTANGEMRVYSYWGTVSSQFADVTLEKDNYIPAGQQRLTMLADIAVGLSQNGNLVFIKLD